MPRIRNSKQVRTILRIEHPEEGTGAYRHIWIDGSQMSKHPAKYCPAPGEDGRLADKLREAFPGNRGSISDLLTRACNYQLRWLKDENNVNNMLSVPLYFGFPNMVCFKAWFSTGARKRARHAGLCMAVYEVHPTCCWIGETQAVFLRPFARRIEVLPVPK